VPNAFKYVYSFRACLESHCFLAETFEHKPNHGQIDDCFTGLGLLFVDAIESAVASQPDAKWLFESIESDFIVVGRKRRKTNFLIAALGHSFQGLIQLPRRVFGVDVHAADWFVRVPGVTYLGNIFPADRLRQET